MPEHWSIYMFLMYLLWVTEKREVKGWLDGTFLVSWIGCLIYGLVKEMSG